MILARRVRTQKKRTATKHHGKIVRLMRLGIVVLYALIDFVMAIYRRETSRVSWVAHLGGAAAGFMVGVVVFKNRKVEKWEETLQKVCSVSFGIIMGVFIVLSAASFPEGHFPLPNYEDIDEQHCSDGIII